MKAWVVTNYGGLDEMKLKEDLPKPEVGDKDLLVRNYGIGSNPVDFKIRKAGLLPVSEDEPLVLGWDAAGVVTEKGKDVTGFEVGDEVMYAGNILRRIGSYAEYTAVDYRIVGKKPKTLGWAEAATVPLVTITAWEALFEEMKVESGKPVLIINGAGGVGSMAIQLARWKGLDVIATASRPETEDWVKKMGATHVISHRKPLAPQLQELGYPKGVPYIFHCHEVGPEMGELMQTALSPMGKLAVVESLAGSHASMDDVSLDLKINRKSLYHCFMYSRPINDIEPEKQKALLDQVADLIDEGVVKCTLTQTFQFEEAKDLMALQESGKAMGKLAMVTSDAS